MALKNVQVPQAGQSKGFSMTGLSVLIISAPSYFSPSEAPLLSFDNPGAGYPVENKNIYPSPSGPFKSIVVTGTAQSAGDEITLLTVPNCLEASIQGFLNNKKARAGNTFNKVMDGTVQQFADIEILDAEGNYPRSLYVAAAGGDINYRWNDGTGVEPSVSGSDYVLSDNVSPIDLLEVVGIEFVFNFQFINSVASATPELIVTARY